MTLFSNLLALNREESAIFLRQKMGYSALVMIFAAGIIAWAFFLRDTERLLQSDSVGAAIPVQNPRYSVALADLPKFLFRAQLDIPFWLVMLVVGGLGIGLAWGLRRHKHLRQRIERAERERKSARRTSQILHQRMEEKIRTRTAELEMSYRVRDNLSQQVRSATEALAAQEKMAALGRVVAGIAHEINTPIGVAVTASSLLAQILAESESTPQNSQQTDRAPSEKYSSSRSQQLITIIEQALGNAAHKIKSFKQVAADQHHSTPRRLEIHHCLQDCVTSLQALVMRQGHQLIFQPQNGDEREFVDKPISMSRTNSEGELQHHRDIWLTTRPDALWQVLSNLITNALIHGFGENLAPRPNLQENLSIKPKKAGVISLSCHVDNSLNKDSSAEFHAPTAQLVIQLADNGAGMRDEIRRQIFEPFFTTKRGQGGTGLGLSICHNLVTTALNGTIECESRENHGTIFRIYLPMTHD